MLQNVSWYCSCPLNSMLHGLTTQGTTCCKDLYEISIQFQFQFIRLATLIQGVSSTKQNESKLNKIQILNKISNQLENK